MEESREKVEPIVQEHGLEQTSSEAIDPEALVGETLGGRYEVTAPIGKGGMGVVYLATQSVLNRQVVVKVLGRGLSGEGEAMQRFEREALGLSQLTHPNIVTIYDFGRDRDQAYIVMEYVDGEMLGELMAQVGHMSFELFAPVAAQILAALAEAHARGIIHRDIKPSNIMLCERHGTPNFVKVLDFGLVKLAGDAKEVTKKQNLMGSVAFLAPEQILGLEFDQRADVYALGVLFYYMLTGQKPFVGDDDIAVLYQHIHKDAAPLHTLLPAGHDIPDGLMELVHRCLNKEPEQRPVDAHAVLALMQGLDARATFALPWSSGEFAAVSRESAALARVRSGSQPAISPSIELTPVSQRQLPTLVRDSSGQYEPVSDATIARHALSSLDAQPAIVHAEAQDSSSRTMALGGIALLLFLLIGGGGALMFWSQQPRDAAPPVIPSASTSPAQDAAERADALLVEVDALLDTSRWGQAEVLLATLKEHEPSPSLLRRVAEREDLIAVGRLLQKASAAEENQEREQAREHYQAILARVPTHPLATKKLADFASEDRAQVMKRGQLLATSSPVATVTVDGMELGNTPLDLELEAGTYTLEFLARGYHSTSQQITISPGEQVRATATLLPLERKPAVSKPATPPEKKTPLESKDLLIPVEKPSRPTLNTTNDLLPVGN